MPLAKDSKYQLNSGHSIPVSGFGIYETPVEKTCDIVYEALDVGYRHIDSARDYGNEKEAGEAIAKFVKDHPDVKRSDIFFTSKIMNRTEPASYEQCLAQLEDSYQNIKDTAEYFDLFLIHCTYPDKATRLNQYKALQEYVFAGKIKSIGVSNWGVKHIDELLAWNGLKIKPAVNQLELQPWLPRKDLQEHGKKHGYLLEAYSPLTRGKKFEDEELVKIAKKHGCTPAEILLKWSYEQGFVPLPKTVTKDRMKANYTVLDRVELDDHDREILDKPESYEVLTWDPTTFVDP